MKDIARLDRNDGSLERFGVRLSLTVSRSVDKEAIEKAITNTLSTATECIVAATGIPPMISDIQKAINKVLD